MLIARQVAKGKIEIVDANELRGANWYLHVFVDDDELLEITLVHRSTGFVPVTYTKMTGATAELADQIQGTTAATEALLSHG